MIYYLVFCGMVQKEKGKGKGKRERKKGKEKGKGKGKGKERVVWSLLIPGLWCR